MEKEKHREMYTKIIFGGTNEDKTDDSISLGKVATSRLRGVITGHLFLQGMRGKDETSEQFLCHYPAFTYFRKLFSERYTLLDLGHVRVIDIKNYYGVR